MMEDEILIRSRTQLDVLLVNIETAVKIKRRSDFFSWVQGVFQGLLAHEILICALFDPAARSYRMESMSSHPLDEQRLAGLCGTSGALVYRLIALWEREGRQPIAIRGSLAPSVTEQSLTAEVQRLELDNVLAHGIPGIDGRAAGFFCFSKMVGGLGEGATSTLELLLPYLYAAWVRANCDVHRQEGLTPLSAKEILTAREVEILTWVEQGKSNNEIAQILGISPLTVKNHIQKILRKLNVQNRAQAVARGMVLNLTRNAEGPGRY
jgi:transcriptional regulator EpsA